MSSERNVDTPCCRFIAAILPMLLAGVSLTAAAAPAPQPGKIDDAILKPVNEETRLNFLASKISELDVHLPPDKAFGFTNSNQVHDSAGRVARGMQTKEKFLTEAAKTLEKRRKEVEQVYAEKLSKAQEFVKKPHNQAELFLLLLTDVTRQMNLPADQDKPRILLGKRLQKLYDEDSQRRNGKARPGAGPDDAWLQKYETESAQEWLGALTEDQKHEAARVWPSVFPDGPKFDAVKP